MHARFIESANQGRLPSGHDTITPAIPNSFFETTYRESSLGTNLPPVRPGGPNFPIPYQRVFEAFGSNTNRNDLLLTEDQLNGAKGQFFILDVPIPTRRFRRLVTTGAGGDDTAVQGFLEELRVVSVALHFQYIADP